MSGNINFNGWINDDGSENYKCRAWVNFNGSGTVAIRASGNVSSITDNGAGNYTVNFTTAMTDANYVASLAAGDAGTSSSKAMFGTYSLTTTGLSFISTNYQNTAQSKDTYLVAIFR